MKNESWSDAILAILLVVLLLTVNPIVSGFVVSQLWAWFVVAKFNAPALNIPEAVGISLTVGWLLRGVAKEESNPKDKSVAYLFILWLVRTVGLAAIALLLGAVVKGFI